MPPRVRGPHAKNWCFTLNNPNEEDVAAFNAAITEHSAFAVYQHEVGESGTRHLQGFLHFGNKVRLEWIRARFSPRAHYECARGTVAQNVAYCTKEDTRAADSVPFTFGEQPAGAGARTDLEDVAAEIVVKRRRLTDVAADFPVDFIKYHGGLTALSARLAQPRRWKSVVYWLYGSTGCGKSRAADRLAPTAYWKMGGNRWWDGYEGHEDVIIDDYRRDLCPFHELLRLFDRYPMRVEYKGGVVDPVPDWDDQSIVATYPSYLSSNTFVICEYKSTADRTVVSSSKETYFGIWKIEAASSSTNSGGTNTVDTTQMVEAIQITGQYQQDIRVALLWLVGLTLGALCLKYMPYQ